ncbi:V-set domain containing T-cell activation inhibitor 1-like [Scomber japonicus]|uniref:V-set domain containing T-cell activation inhibitor 1-like n=1 Tax=Scomber japonicus TaxID=13676 RepID=UPI00230552E5|nr:V-set domain containing T-cell activation inhibitor 1-like [Scomber japonicus]
MSAHLLLALLLSCAALANSKKIPAFAGQTVLLPCHIDVSDDIPTVEWSKEGLAQPNIAFLYRDGCETHAMKNPVFQYRTHLIMNKLKNGDISLVISNVQLSDAGKYICKTVQGSSQQVVATLELIVGAVPEPKLSIISVKGDEVTLQCDVDCCPPEPEITFVDDKGHTISAENPRRNPSGRCFNITRRVAVPTTTNSVTCRVHQPETDQTRDKGIDISDVFMGSCAPSPGITVLVAIFGFACGFGFAAFLWKFVSSQSNLAGSDVTLDTADDFGSGCGDVVDQQNQPTIDDSVSRMSLDTPKPDNLPPDYSPKARRFSDVKNPKPAATTKSNPPKSSNTSGEGHLVRSKSVSVPRSGQNIDRFQRRNTFSGNRYAPLEDLVEE